VWPAEKQRGRSHTNGSSLHIVGAWVLDRGAVSAGLAIGRIGVRGQGRRRGDVRLCGTEGLRGKGVHRVIYYIVASMKYFTGADPGLVPVCNIEQLSAIDGRLTTQQAGPTPLRYLF
jgi:hypothetical protein